MVTTEFVKTGTKAALSLELVKANAARACPAHGVEFYVPKPLGWSDENVLRFEHIQGFQTTYQCLRTAIVPPDQLGRALGRGLATAHQQMQLPSHELRRWDLLWGTDPDENVCLHGDFTKANTGFVPPCLRPILLDWSLAPSITRSVTLGSRYFDCILFIFDLWYSLPHDRPSCRMRASLIGALLAGYSEVSALREPTLVLRAERWYGILKPIIMDGVQQYVRRPGVRNIFKTGVLLLRLNSWKRTLQRASQLKSLTAAISERL